MGLNVGNLPVKQVYVGSTPVKAVYVGSELVWSATVQITLSTVENNMDARDQLRAALSARGLNFGTVTEIPFEIKLVGTGSTEQLFQNCYALTTAPEMDTSQVTNMKDMFSQCRALTHVTDMDTSQVTNMRGVFYNCQALTHAPALDTSQAVDLSYLFANCSSLTSVPAMDTSSATGMRSMFSGCSSLTHAPALNTSKVVDSAYMFQSCSSLVYVPDMDTSQNTDLYAMFKGCSSLTDGNVRLSVRHPQANTIAMIQDSGLTQEPFYTQVHQATLTDVDGMGTAYPLVSVTVPAGQVWDVQIQGTVTATSSITSNQPVFRIGSSTSAKFGPGASVNFSGTVSSTNATIAMVTNDYSDSSFTGTVTIRR